MHCDYEPSYLRTITIKPHKVGSGHPGCSPEGQRWLHYAPHVYRVREIAEREHYELTLGTLDFIEADIGRVRQPTMPLW